MLFVSLFYVECYLWGRIMGCITLLPRLIRLRDAPDYVGMDRHRFNEDVRPSITEVPIGSQGIAFDRLDLDAWVDDYKRCSGRPAATKQRSLDKWDENERRGIVDPIDEAVIHLF